MRLYQIGCIVEPWINLRPPIRGGIFREHPEEEALLDSDDDLSTASTITAFSTASDTSQDSSDEAYTRRKDRALSNGYSEHKEWSQAYVAKLIQGEVDDNIRDYPSLDADTQGAINLKFQALHQRVKDDGYYHCHFGEYMKELSRYALLFACFYGTLRAGWYLVSAAFLGLFWVSIHSFSKLKPFLSDTSIK